MTEDGSTPEQEPEGPRSSRRSPWLQAGINAAIAFAAVLVLGFFVSMILRRGDSEAMGELVGTIAFNTLIAVYVVSIIWLKVHRIVAILLIAAALTLIVVGIVNIERSEDAGWTAFCDAVCLGVDTVEAEYNTKIVHKGLGIEMSVPYTELEVFPMQHPDSLSYIWTYYKPEIGSSFFLGVSYVDLPTQDDFEDFINGMLNSSRDNALQQGLDFNIVSRQISDEEMTGYVECTAGTFTIAIRAIYVTSDDPGFYSLASVMAFDENRHVAWSTAYSLFVSQPSEWIK